MREVSVTAYAMLCALLGENKDNQAAAAEYLCVVVSQARGRGAVLL